MAIVTLLFIILLYITDGNNYLKNNNNRNVLLKIIYDLTGLFLISFLNQLSRLVIKQKS